MELLPIYLRREPTNDALTLKVAADLHGGRLAPRERDVVAYRDANCTDRAGRWTWHYSNKPDRRNKYVTLNCWRFRAVWVDAVEGASK